MAMSAKIQEHDAMIFRADEHVLRRHIAMHDAERSSVLVNRLLPERHAAGERELATNSRRRSPIAKRSGDVLVTSVMPATGVP